MFPDTVRKLIGMDQPVINIIRVDKEGLYDLARWNPEPHIALDSEKVEGDLENLATHLRQYANEGVIFVSYLTQDKPPEKGTIGEIYLALHNRKFGDERTLATLEVAYLKDQGINVLVGEQA